MTNVVVRPDPLPQQPGFSAVPARPGGLPGKPISWSDRYHNTLLVNAITMAMLTAGLFLLLWDPTIPPVFIGAGIGFGAIAGAVLWLWYPKRYAPVATGGSLEPGGSQRGRYLIILGICIAVIALVAYSGWTGLFGPLLALMLGVSIFAWASYGITVLWEGRHRVTLVSEEGSPRLHAIRQ
jgi:hypothetical protein